MKHATSRELYDYWNRLRGREAAPERSDIEPSDIRRILPDTFILEVVDRNRYLFRLAGTRICSVYGREIKGSDFLDLWGTADRQAMATLATAVASDAAAAVLTIEVRTARDRALTAELLLLPLRHGGPAYDRIIGSCAAIERPYWVGAEPIVDQTNPRPSSDLARRAAPLHAARERPRASRARASPWSRRQPAAAGPSHRRRRRQEPARHSITAGITAC